MATQRLADSGCHSYAKLSIEVSAQGSLCSIALLLFCSTEQPYRPITAAPKFFGSGQAVSFWPLSSF